MLRARPSSPARQLASLMLMLFFAEGLAHGGQDAGLVRGGDRELHRAVDLGLRVPAHLDAALGVGVERLGAFAAVDGDAAAAGDEADDGVAGQRVTALGVAHQHVVDAADLDAGLVAPGDLAHELLDAARAQRRGGFAVPARLRASRRACRRRRLRFELAVADGEQELVQALHGVALRRRARTSASFLMNLEKLMPAPRISFSSSSWPRLMLFWRCSARMWPRMRARARVVTQKSSQSLLGCWFCEVMISMTSPFFSL